MNELEITIGAPSTIEAIMETPSSIIASIEKPPGITAIMETPSNITASMGGPPSFTANIDSRTVRLGGIEDVLQNEESVVVDNIAYVTVPTKTSDLVNDTISVSATGTAIDTVQYITINGVEKKLAGGGGSMPPIDNHTLIVQGGVMKVHTTDDAQASNDLPITSSGVNLIVGNINALLSAI